VSSYACLPALPQVKSCVVLVFTNVLMPVLINARVDSLAFVPLLFKGEHEDFDSRWYDSVGDSLMLTAAIKIVVWPLRWPLLHLATRVRARLLSASAATQVSSIVGSCEMGQSVEFWLGTGHSNC